VLQADEQERVALGGPRITELSAQAQIRQWLVGRLGR
jgi:hypothetical protein